MTHLLALALLSLFTPFKLLSGFVQLRPFDGLAVMFVLTLLNRNIRLQDRLPTGFLILLPYFFWHVFSAMTGGLGNGLREGLQIAIVTAFAFTLVVQADRIDYAKLARLMLIGLALITAYNIYWHIDHGFWSGWKRLLDPKRAFSFLPLVLGCLILFSAVPARRRYWMLWAMLGGVILFSGERKALLVYLILFAALTARGRLLAAIPAAAVGIAAVALFGSVVEDPYLERQISSILDPFSSTLPLSAIASGEIPESLSNAQRAFALQLSTEMFLQHPVMGVGTNAYSDIILARFAYLPKFMQNAPHGEFVRILVENGAIGLMLYLSVWGVALVRLRRNLRGLIRGSLMTRAQATVLQLVLLVPAFMYVTFEAAGTHSLVVLIMVSLLPELCSSAFLGQRRKGAIQSRSALAYPGRGHGVHDR